ncbi:MAG: TIM barrel protein [Capsulimonadaceae bacterium]|nr:TIM barrel protein [Capsulimonadaceae bacterium]
MLKQSFSWWSFANKGVDDAALLNGARKIGFEGVELLPGNLLAAARDCGFVIASHNGHNSIGDGLNNPANHDRIAREIDENLTVAAKYGIANLIVFSGNRLPGQSDDEGAEVIAAGLRRVARSAEDAGVTLIMELLNSKVDHAGYQADHTDWLAKIVDAVGSERFKILYDIYHMQIMEGDLVRTIGAHASRIAHYHTAGNPGRHELIGEMQEISYPAVFRAIAATGYNGFVGHEIVPAGNPLDALREAYGLCRESVG